jgi:multiple sugar transport system substrate-binding protein
MRPSLYQGDVMEFYHTISCCLLGICVIFGLCGCGNSSAKAKDKVHLVMAVTVLREIEPRYRAAIAQFEAAHPNIEVELLTVAGNYYDKVLLMIAGRNAPDLMWMGSGFVEFAERGALLDITDRVAKEVDTSKYPPLLLKWYRSNDKQYGIPFGIDTQFIVYNKQLFDEAGVPYPRDGWDYADFLDKAHKLTKDRDGDGRIDQYGFSGELDYATFGAEIITPDARRAVCNSPEMIAYLQTNLDLIHKEKVSLQGKGGGDATLDESTSLFHQRRVAMMLMFTWDLPYIRERYADMQWDLVTNPKVKQYGHWASSQAIVISSATKHPEEAWALAKTFFGEEHQRRMSDILLPTDQSLAARLAAENRSPNVHAVLMRATPYLHSLPRVPNSTELLQYFYDARDSVRFGRATPREAMMRAEKQINRAIQKHARLEQ